MDIDARLKNDGIDAGTRRVLRRTELALWDIVRTRKLKTVREAVEQFRETRKEK